MYYLVVSKINKHKFFDKNNKLLFSDSNLGTIVEQINGALFIKNIDIVLDGFCFQYEEIFIDEPLYKRIFTLKKIEKCYIDQQKILGFKKNTNYTIFSKDNDLSDLINLQKIVRKVHISHHLASLPYLKILQKSKWVLLITNAKVVSVFKNGSPILDRAYEAHTNWQTFLREIKEYLYRFDFTNRDTLHEIESEWNVQYFDYGRTIYLAHIKRYLSFFDITKCILRWNTLIMATVVSTLFLSTAYFQTFVFEHNKSVYQDIDFVRSYKNISENHLKHKEPFWNNFFMVITKFEEIFGNRAMIQKISIEEKSVTFEMDKEAEVYFQIGVLGNKEHSVKKPDVKFVGKKNEKDIVIKFDI